MWSLLTQSYIIFVQDLRTDWTLVVCVYSTVWTTPPHTHTSSHTHWYSEVDFGHMMTVQCHPLCVCAAQWTDVGQRPASWTGMQRLSQTTPGSQSDVGQPAVLLSWLLLCHTWERLQRFLDADELLPPCWSVVQSLTIAGRPCQVRLCSRCVSVLMAFLSRETFISSDVSEK